MKEPKGRVIWITGFSGAGKTTLAKALLPRLPQPVVLLDGDEMREALSLLRTGFDHQSRRHLAMTYGRLCKLLADQSMTVVCATISMFHEVRQWNRDHLPNYFEIFLDVDESVRRERDPKKLYRHGTAEMAGIDVHAELPTHPDLHFRLDETHRLDEVVETVLDRLEQTDQFL